MTPSRILKLLIFALLVAGLAGAEQQTVSGYLMDKACSADAVKKGEKVAREHDKGCALMDDCVKSGYGVLSGGKFIGFDAAGNKRAMAALKESNKTTDFRVTVTGDVSGNSMKVATLKLE